MDKTLRALKDFRYGTRRLKAGDYFEAGTQHRRVLIAMKRAEELPGGRLPADVPPMPARLKRRARNQARSDVPAGSPPPDPFDHDNDGNPGGSAAPPDSDELRGLRSLYTEIMGKRPFPGWDVATLRAKLEAADPAPDSAGA